MFKENSAKNQGSTEIRVISIKELNVPDLDRNPNKFEYDPKVKMANIDEALEATGFGKFNYFLIIITGILLTSPLMEILSISFILPVIDCDLNLKTAEKANISAAEFIGIITSSHLWGFLADTIGRRRILRPAIIAAFLTTVVSSFMNSFWSLIVFRFLNGFFVSAGYSIPLAYLGEFHTKKIRSKAIMGSSIMYGVCPLIVPIVAWLMINESWRFHIPFLDITYKPWRLFMIVCGLPGLISTLCLYIIPESPKFTLLQKDQGATIKTLRKMFTINTGKPIDEYPYTEILQEETSSDWIPSGKEHKYFGIFHSMWHQTVALFRKNFLRQTIILCIIRFLIYILTNGMNVWFPKVLDQIGDYQRNNPNNRSTICEIFQLNGSQDRINSSDVMVRCKETLVISTYYNTLLLEIGYLVGFVLLTFVVNRISKIKLLFSILFVTGLCGVAAVYIRIPLLATYLYLVLMLGGIGSIVLNIIIVDLYPTTLRAMAVSLTFLAGCVGSVVGTNTIGILLDKSCISAFLFAAGSLIIGAFLGLFIPMPKKN